MILRPIIRKAASQDRKKNFGFIIRTSIVYIISLKLLSFGRIIKQVIHPRERTLGDIFVVVGPHVESLGVLQILAFYSGLFCILYFVRSAANGVGRILVSSMWG